MLYYRYVEDDYCEVVAGPGKYAGVIDIPAYVTEKSIPVVGVGFMAFYYCNELTEVHVPNTVLYLESGSFYANYHLTAVTLSENLVAIGELAFENCFELTNINIPQSLEYVGYFAFSHCTKTGPLYNDRYFFYYPMLNYDDLGQSYSIPEGIEVIGISALSFVNLDEVIIPNSVHTIMENAFDGSEITHITIPPSVKTIQRKAFGQTRLTEVVIPETVQEIGTELFDSSLELRKATLLNPLDSIPYATFHCCTRLEDVHYPATVHKVGAHAFRYAKFPSFDFSTLDTIGVGAFYGCEALTEVTLPETITEIPDDAFDLCSGISQLNLPRSLKRIGRYAFYQNTSLTRLCLPDAMVSVDHSAFAFCRNLGEIHLGRGLKYIGESAFSQNDKLTMLDIPSSVETIELLAFGYCTVLKDVIVHWDTPLPMVFDAFDSYQFYLGMTLHVPAGTQELYANAPCWSQFTTIQTDADNLHHPTVDSLSGPKHVKKLRDGQFVIEKGNLRYNLQGQEL